VNRRVTALTRRDGVPRKEDVTRATVVLRELTSLLRRGRGSPDERITRALSLLVEQLDMRTAIVSRFHEGRRVITHLAGEPVQDASLLAMPAEETICHLVAAGEVGPLVADTRSDPVLERHAHVEAYSVGAWVGVPLVVGGEVTGTLCAMSPVSRPDLTERDGALLATVGEYVAEVLAAVGGTAPPRPANVPAPRPPVDLPDAAAALAGGDDLEGMTRPVLELVHEITGLESAYLTLIDWAGDAQQVKYSLNTGGMHIPEGLRVPWEGTLCRRSLNEGRPYTRDVPLVWGDSQVARDLGIQTYVSVPLRDADDLVVGTLCGTSRDRVDLDDRALHSMRMFAQLLSAQLQREAARAAARERAGEHVAVTEAAAGGPGGHGRDPVTGLLTRPSVSAWLRSVVPGLRPGVERLAVGWIDAVPAGGLLATPEGWEESLTGAVLGVGRAGDLHGRVGESFVVAAVLPAGEAGLGVWRDRLSYVVSTQASASNLHATLGVETTDDPTADPEGLLQRAAVATRTRAVHA
jgi:GAF domain-containing protein